MLELAIAVLQLYVLFSIIVSLLSTVLHLVPVIYSLRNAGISCFASSHSKTFTIAYLLIVFTIAPKIAFMFLDSKSYKMGLYEALKAQ